MGTSRSCRLSRAVAANACRIFRCGCGGVLCDRGARVASVSAFVARSFSAAGG